MVNNSGKVAVDYHRYEFESLGGRTSNEKLRGMDQPLLYPVWRYYL